VPVETCRGCHKGTLGHQGPPELEQCANDLVFHRWRGGKGVRDLKGETCYGLCCE